MNVATGLAKGRASGAELAREAVECAMARAGTDIANSVLLFLTPECAHDAQPALLAASRAASCTGIVGCTAAGVFTEEEWVLDGCAAAAMVLAGSAHLEPAHAEEPVAGAPTLSLATPGVISSAWLAAFPRRFGGIAGDATGQGGHKVWCGGKVAASGHCEAVVAGARGALAVSQGVLALGQPVEVTRASGYDVLDLAQEPALHVLARNLPPEVREMERIPLHLLMVGVTFGDPTDAIAEGRFRLAPVIAANLDDRSVTLSTRLAPGERMFWALRQPFAAERDFAAGLYRLARETGPRPGFGLLFPCIGRGPHFYGGVDRDLELVKEHFPGMPLIGFYGNGEIAPLQGVNELLQYSAVLGVFSGV
jgi:small ligand-binding sensory domain FIST